MRVTGGYDGEIWNYMTFGKNARVSDQWEKCVRITQNARELEDLWDLWLTLDSELFVGIIKIPKHYQFFFEL